MRLWSLTAAGSWASATSASMVGRQPAALTFLFVAQHYEDSRLRKRRCCREATPTADHATLGADTCWALMPRCSPASVAVICSRLQIGCAH